MTQPIPAHESARPGETSGRETPAAPSPPGPGPSRRWGWGVLLAGLALYTLVQGLLVSIPLWTRSLPPEVDDSLAYLVRTRQMEECFFQDCPALLDLKEQRQIGLDDPKVVRAHDLSAFPFPIYHPLFSALILGAQVFTGDLITAYKVLWTLSPLFLGIAFACLLAVLWGRSAAGVTLALLAFKIFPDTGLHYFTPSNLAMGVAVLMWARIIARGGDAPWTLLPGSMALVLIHPIGVIHVLVAMALSISCSWSFPRARRKAMAASSTVFCILGLAALAASRASEPSLVTIHGLLQTIPSLDQALGSLVSNIAGVVVGIVRLQDSLLGPMGILMSAMAAGFLLTRDIQAKAARGFLLVHAPLLSLALFHSHVTSPMGDLFFRIWIPPLVVLFGAVGQAIIRLAMEAKQCAQGCWSDTEPSLRPIMNRYWPALVLLMLAGTLAQTALQGGEHIVAMIQHMRERQPLAFEPSQPRLLLNHAKTGDRVLHTAIMPMAYYFTQGAMQLGAVFHHPAYGETSIASDWLSRADIRFAVVYHPAVRHPSLDGLDEKDQCLSGPDLRFSPLSSPRRFSTILKDGHLHGDEFTWIEVQPRGNQAPGRLRVLAKASSPTAEMTLSESTPAGAPLSQASQTVRLSSPGWAWVELDIPPLLQHQPLRLTLPGGRAELLIGGIVFDDSPLHWPWEQKTEMTLHAKSPETGEVKLDFDPAGLLPKPLTARGVRVLDDRGSSVLLELTP